jgi:(1->4)-alpha-D-glucan 1-alpha-D-glucosylmutase
VLSELPRDWSKRVSRWAALNRKRKTQVDGEPAPSRNDEYLLYQTLIGTWPWESPRGDALVAYRARIQAYMAKALREAKVHTSWIAPYEPYEQAMAEFVAAILDRRRGKAFLAGFEPFAQEVARCGMWNSLSQTLLKLTSPGVPDIYQGTELWDFSLVDPDNRRPVDYELRQRWLRELDDRLRERGTGALAEELLATATDGRIKLYVISQALRWRREAPELFTVGSYVPLTIQGPLADHACAFARQQGGSAAVVIVPRFTATLASPRGAPPLGGDVWRETSCPLPADLGTGPWRHVYTGDILKPGPAGDLSLAEVFARFPVALLRAGDGHVAL